MICVSIAEATYEAILKAMFGERMVEIRLDFVPLSDEEFETLFSQQQKIIATCREGHFSDEQRMERLKKAISTGANLVDIEYEAPKEYREELVEFAKMNNCEVIISYHDYKQTPSREELDKIITECFDMGAHICKLATMVNNTGECARIMSVYDDDRRIVAFGMGEKGKLSRLASVQLGAEFTFAAKSKEKTTAPGQMGRREMEEILDTIGEL